MADSLQDLDPTGRFSTRADNYAKYRPSYPPELIAFLERVLGLGRAWQIADIGSGTGILTELLLLKGCRVTGVEPNAAMRKVAEERLGGYERFYSQEGRAEQTGLEDHSVDLITVAQAFHWMDPEAARTEFVRILRPGGHISLIWNLRMSHTPFLQAYEALVREFGQHIQAANRIDENAITAVFLPLRKELQVFSNTRLLDFESLKGLALSASYMPLEGHASFAEMIRRMEELFARYNENGLVKMEYETKVYYNL
jgi:ubiquinone/menaquinone biosynthesis C-methylase UbiE